MMKKIIKGLGVVLFFLVAFFQTQFSFEHPFIRPMQKVVALTSTPSCADKCRHFLGEVCTFTHEDENGAKQIITCLDHDEKKSIGL